MIFVPFSSCCRELRCFVDGLFQQLLIGDIVEDEDFLCALFCHISMRQTGIFAGRL